MTPARMSVWALLALAGSCGVFLDLRGRARSEQWTVSAAYALRMALIVTESLWPRYRPFYFGTSDSEKFYQVALAYYRGDFSTYFTTYPYFLNGIFHVFGPGRFVPLLINVLCWYACWMVFRRTLSDCEEKRYYLLLLVHCFMPTGVLLTTEMLRESIMMLFMALSFCSLLRWMESGSSKHLITSLLLAVPAIALHSVSVVLWCVDVVVYLFWDEKKQKWGLSRRKAAPLIAVVLLLFCVFHFKLYGYFEYFPEQISVHDLTWRPYDLSGRTNYLMDVEVTTWPQFFAWTPVRCIYFWLSPMVYDWSALVDAATVVFDVLPLLGLFYLSWRRSAGTEDRRYYAGHIALLLYTLVYAWGVTNAGTAMRHRNMLIGLLLMTCSMCASSGRGNEEGKLRGSVT